MVFLPAMAAVAILFAGCSPTADSSSEHGPQTPSNRQQVVLCGAASLADVLDAIADRFAASQAVEVVTNFASSGTLAQQLALGAPGDVFISAHPQWAHYLLERGLAARAVPLLENHLVVVVPTGSPLVLRKPEDLLGDSVRQVAVGDPESVPAGMYARDALKRVGLWEKLQAKLVSSADVRQALAYVESGAAEAGIVYATDAALSDRVQTAFRLDEHLPEPIRYVAVLLQPASKRSVATALFDYLQSPEAADLFSHYGFTVLHENAQSHISGGK